MMHGYELKHRLNVWKRAWSWVWCEWTYGLYVSRLVRVSVSFFGVLARTHRREEQCNKTRLVLQPLWTSVSVENCGSNARLSNQTKNIGTMITKGKIWTVTYMRRAKVQRGGCCKSQAFSSIFRCMVTLYTNIGKQDDRDRNWFANTIT